MPNPADETDDATHEERRRVRRRRRARLRAAELGRLGGGLTTKAHLAAEHRCRPLSFILTPGQAADSPRFIPVVEQIRVRGLAGRRRARPDAIAGDKAYSSRANRAYLRRRRIRGVIPEKADQTANRSPSRPSATARDWSVSPSGSRRSGRRRGPSIPGPAAAVDELVCGLVG
ncbi:transposase [Streptomyces ambofaciens]|uniref:transposase n=1 Tax=Streptomyces ambofaciens TaxID=1889 RepID=UPI000A81E038